MRCRATAVVAMVALVLGLTGCNAPPDPGAERSTAQAKELQNRFLTTQTDR